MSLDLRDALDSRMESDESRCENCSFNASDVEEEVFPLATGLDLVVCRDTKTMEGVATVMLAANRMKQLLHHSGRQLSSDDDVCRAMVDSVIEETVVKSVKTDSGSQNLVFHRVNSLECTVQDDCQKQIICALGDLKLQAITLKGGNGSHKVTFKLVKYVNAAAAQTPAQTVALSIANHNLYISCCMNGDAAELKLETCYKDDIKKISSDSDRFLFYDKETGKDVHTFESVRCRGWFISSSYEVENEPLEMCRVDAARRLTCFKINKS